MYNLGQRFPINIKPQALAKTKLGPIVFFNIKIKEEKYLKSVT